jgi:glutathione peroxidase
MSDLEPTVSGGARRPGLLGRMLGALSPRTRGPAVPHVASAHDFAFQSIDGTPMNLADYRGRAVLLVNTASQCGFTAQYAGLQHLHTTYRDRGLTVIGVPSNDFGAQEPGTDEQIKAFCRSHFGVNFPMTGKTSVVGPDAHPFYRWAAHELGPVARPRWNFPNYLVAPDGTLADWFSTVAGPTSHRVLGGIERVLPS